ncbi:hypothetical protein J4Q44_G00043100 [Coregonus suidteri]|uniref:SEA domain-containing protein n=1 Tax=Coregonus suidteri TaxID=861788 RepID=A0AAN8ME15_9TELE
MLPHLHSQAIFVKVFPGSGSIKRCHVLEDFDGSSLLLCSCSCPSDSNRCPNNNHSSDEIFASNLSDNSSVVFSDRATKTKNEIEPFYRKAFKSFIQLFVLKFTRGSIITDCRMEFRITGNETAPNANSVKDVLVAAVNSGNLSIRVNASSITVSVQVTPTAAPTTTTGANTTTTAANTTTTGAPTTTTAAVASTTTNFFLLVFSSDEIFASNLSDNSSVVFSDRATKTKNEIEPFYRKAFKSFIQLFVLKFTRGSIITDCRMEFRLTGNETAPNANSVKDVLVAAVNSGNLSIRVNASSITVSVQVTPNAAPKITTGANTTTTAANTTTTAANKTTTGAPTTTTGAPTTTTAAPQTTTAAVASTTTSFFLLVFSSDEIFANTLSDSTSAVFRDRATKTKNAIEPFYRKAFKSFIQLFVLKFTRGSIITDCRMEFRLTGNETAPNANSVKDVLVAAVNSGNLSISVNASSITVSVLSSSMSPVVNGVFSSFGMTVVFLLLSAAMHRL